MKKDGKHENYEILNLIGYGLAKFEEAFVRHFGFKTKTAFYEFIIKNGIAETVGTVKNRQDLFDPFFDNKRKGWWQKGEVYIHRKIFIDSLFGDLKVEDFANIVKLYLKNKYNVVDKEILIISPVLKSKFKQLQMTGLEAELFFMNNYRRIESFQAGSLEDARLFGDGYDFQIKVQNHFFLVEIKGLRTGYGGIRFTKNEYVKATQHRNNYGLVVVSNLIDAPKMSIFFNPLDSIHFIEKTATTKQTTYHTNPIRWQ